MPDASPAIKANTNHPKSWSRWALGGAGSALDTARQHLAKRNKTPSKTCRLLPWQLQGRLSRALSHAQHRQSQHHAVLPGFGLKVQGFRCKPAVPLGRSRAQQGQQWMQVFFVSARTGASVKLTEPFPRTQLSSRSLCDVQPPQALEE